MAVQVQPLRECAPLQGCPPLLWYHLAHSSWVHKHVARLHRLETALAGAGTGTSGSLLITLLPKRHTLMLPTQHQGAPSPLQPPFTRSPRLNEGAAHVTPGMDLQPKPHLARPARQPCRTQHCNAHAIHSGCKGCHP